MSLEQAIDALRDARRLVVLTGAGVSTESGIPDFRSPGGLWTRFDPDEFHIHRFRADPVRFWTMRAELMRALDLPRVQPNPAHEAIARASRSPRFLGHVTQNIDGLFARAAAQLEARLGAAAPSAASDAGRPEEKLVEIHGSAAKVRCTECLRFFPYEAVSLATLPPSCPDCGGVVKPGTVLFGEELPEDALERAAQWMRHADALLVAGTSLQVHPVASLPALAVERGAHLVVVNRDPTPYDQEADAVLREPLSLVLPQLLGGFR